MVDHRHLHNDVRYSDHIDIVQWRKLTRSNSMASAGYGPNYAAVQASFGLPPSMPIRKFAGTPPPGLATGGEGFVGSLNGLNLAVYAYGGALLFAALLAEMRY